MKMVAAESPSDGRNPASRAVDKFLVASTKLYSHLALLHQTEADDDAAKLMALAGDVALRDALLSPSTLPTSNVDVSQPLVFAASKLGRDLVLRLGRLAFLHEPVAAGLVVATWPIRDAFFLHQRLSDLLHRCQDADFLSL